MSDTTHRYKHTNDYQSAINLSDMVNHKLDLKCLIVRVLLLTYLLGHLSIESGF